MRRGRTRMRPLIFAAALIASLLVVGLLYPRRDRRGDALEEAIRKPALRGPLDDGDDDGDNDPPLQPTALAASVPWHEMLARAAPNRPTHLIVVACYGVFVGKTKRELTDFDAGWKMEAWQRGLQRNYLNHIRLGVSLIKDPMDDVLIFSGGQTKAEAEGISEGAGYLRAARLMGLVRTGEGEEEQEGGARVEGRRRIAVEGLARDSMENLLFSLCRFKMVSGGNYPTRLTVVNYGFKRRRTVQVHLNQAIGYPLERVDFVATNPELYAQLKMERETTIPQFLADPYGCRAPLSTKKEQRNPFHLSIESYREACAELRPLFDACHRH